MVRAARTRQSEWLADEPDLAAHEAAALVEAQRAGLLAPRLMAYASDDVGFGAPVVLMSFIEGEIELRPTNFQQWLGDLASQLASIHRHAADAFPWRFRSWVNRAILAPPEWSTVPRVWERAIELLLGAEPNSRPSSSTATTTRPTSCGAPAPSVASSTDQCCRGPAGVDVAHCRTNLAQMYGPDIADQFLDAYLEVADGLVTIRIGTSIPCWTCASPAELLWALAAVRAQHHRSGRTQATDRDVSRTCHSAIVSASTVDRIGCTARSPMRHWECCACLLTFDGGKHLHIQYVRRRKTQFARSADMRMAGAGPNS